MSGAAEGVTAAAEEPAGLLGRLRRVDRGIQRLEVAMAAGVLLVMVLLSFAQVFLRAFRGQYLQPVGWFDVVSYHLVIWIGLLGASLATAEGRHIAIEAVPKLLGPAGKRRLDALVHAVGLVVCGLLAALAVVYIHRAHYRGDATLFVIDLFGAPRHVRRWPFLVVVPIGLVVMSLRFALRTLEALVLGDEDYARTHRPHEEVAAVGEEVHEEEEARVLVEHERAVARESGRRPQLDTRAAKWEVRKVMRSDRFRKLTAEELAEPAGPPPSGPLDAEGAPRDPLRSTAELPVYRDLGEDEDLDEPHHRPPRTEGGGTSTSDLGELDVLPTGSDDYLADDAVEAMADTRRVHPPDEHDEHDDEPHPPRWADEHEPDDEHDDDGAGPRPGGAA